MTEKALRHALERARDLLPSYGSKYWKKQPDKVLVDAGVARVWLVHVLDKLPLDPTMPTKKETDLDAEHLISLAKFTIKKRRCIEDAGDLEHAINHSTLDKRVGFLEIIGTLAKYGIELSEPGFDHRIKDEAVQDLIELGELVEGMVEDYLEEEE